jgi:hypothetical protein
MATKLADEAKRDFVLEICDREFTDEPPATGKTWAVTEEA